MFEADGELTDMCEALFKKGDMRSRKISFSRDAGLPFENCVLRTLVRQFSTCLKQFGPRTFMTARCGSHRWSLEQRK